MAVAFSMNVVTATYWFPHCTSCGQTETNTAGDICTMVAFAQCKCRPELLLCRQGGNPARKSLCAKNVQAQLRLRKRLTPTVD